MSVPASNLFLSRVRTSFAALALMSAAACVESPAELASTEGEVLNGAVVTAWDASAPSHQR